jgi:hypothetical protein
VFLCGLILIVEENAQRMDNERWNYNTVQFSTVLYVLYVLCLLYVG